MNNQSSLRIAFIGGGNMARALIGGLLRQGVAASHVSVGEPQASLREALQRELAVTAVPDNALAIHGAQMVVLAVKPQAVASVVQELSGALRAQRPVLLSIVAGLRIAQLTRVCSAAVPIVRAMPNRPALIGAGVTGLYAPSSVTDTQRNMAERVASAAGRVVWLRSEAELDIVTALSGSGPAYFFLLAEQLALAGESLGLERETALLLARDTLYGAGALAQSARSLAEERVAVTSKGGTTEAALQALQLGGFDVLIDRAVRAAAERSVALADAVAGALGPPPDLSRS
jgi:pyrroline-5-carboxylate reductase